MKDPILSEIRICLLHYLQRLYESDDFESMHFLHVELVLSLLQLPLTFSHEVPFVQLKQVLPSSLLLHLVLSLFR